MRILIVDDEPLARARLRGLLSDFPDVELAGEAGDGEAALRACDRHRPDLVMLDIRMPGMDGMEVARRLAARPSPPLVVFCTAFDGHALSAFETDAIDYLVKPVRVQRLLSALQKVPKLKPLNAERISQLPANARRFLSVTERSRVVLVPIDEVVYLKAELKYITIRTANREHLLEESLTRLEQEFGHRFVRVHRNCLVARDAIRGFERRVNDDGDAHWEVLLNGLSETLPVSRRQQGIVREMAKESVG